MNTVKANLHLNIIMRRSIERISLYMKLDINKLILFFLCKPFSLIKSCNEGQLKTPWSHLLLGIHFLTTTQHPPSELTGVRRRWWSSPRWRCPAPSAPGARCCCPGPTWPRRAAGCQDFWRDIQLCCESSRQELHSILVELFGHFEPPNSA